MQQTQQGTLYIVSAPSGAGKTSLVSELLNQTQGIMISVSHTTRAPRPGEEDGIAYNFVDVDSFKQMAAKDDFLEHAEVFGNFYGTSRSWVETKLNEGIDVILEIDWQGAQQIRKTLDHTISIFIIPPSKEALRERLSNRGTDSEEVIAGRMAEATSETSHFDEYDYLIVNDNFEEALASLKAVFIANRQRICQQIVRNKSTLENLLAEN